MSDKDTELEKVAQVLDRQAVVIRKLVAESALGNEDFLKARSDEVWQEAGGCLLTRGYSGWWAFGVENEFSEKDQLERVALPLRRLLLSDATLDPAYTNFDMAERQQLSLIHI